MVVKAQREAKRCEAHGPTQGQTGRQGNRPPCFKGLSLRRSISQKRAQSFPCEPTGREALEQDCLPLAFRRWFPSSEVRPPLGQLFSGGSWEDLFQWSQPPSPDGSMWSLLFIGESASAQTSLTGVQRQLPERKESLGSKRKKGQVFNFVVILA